MRIEIDGQVHDELDILAGCVTSVREDRANSTIYLIYEDGREVRLTGWNIEITEEKPATERVEPARSSGRRI